MDPLIVNLIKELFPQFVQLVVGGIKTFVKTSKALTPEQQEVLLAELDEPDFEDAHFANRLVWDSETGKVEVE